MNKKAMSPIPADTLRPQVESFFRRMTPEQWALLQSGEPDEVTKVMVAELLVELAAIISAAVLRALEEKFLREADIQSSIGDAIRSSFVEALDVKDVVKCTSSEQLTELLVGEVAESLGSVRSGSSKSPSPVCCIGPKRLNKMVNHACEMLKTFLAKIHLPRPQKIKTPSPMPKEEDQDHDQDQDQDQGQDLQGQDQQEKVESVQEIICKELNALIEPLLDEVSDSELEVLGSESSLEIRMVADEIDQLRAASGMEPECRSPSPEPQKVKGKIRHIVSKAFLHASICRIMAKTRSKFHLSSKTKSRQSVQSLMANVDTLLSTEDMGQPEQDPTEDQAVPCQEIERPQAPHIVKQLTDLLYSHLTDTRLPEYMLPLLEEAAASAPQTQDELYNELQRRMAFFMDVINWWLNTQAIDHSHRLMLTLMPHPSSAISPSSSKERKMYIRIIVDNFVNQTFINSKVIFPGNSAFLARRLLTKVWAEVKDTEFQTNPEALANLDKVIFKDLCKTFGCVEALLFSMELRDPLLDELLISAIKTHLPQQQQQQQFFSRARRFLCGKRHR